MAVINTFVHYASNTDAVYSAKGGLAFFINRSVSFDFALTYTGGDTGAVRALVAGGANPLTPYIPKALTINLDFQVYFPK